MSEPAPTDAATTDAPVTNPVPIVASSLRFDNSFVRELPSLYVPWQATPAPSPELVVLDEELAAELGASAAELRSPDGVAMLCGNAVPEGAEPVAQAYAGHQFGSYSPRLGDGRALLLGEVVAPDGRRWDLTLKGSGRTPFARGGDGLAALGPMLREYLMCTAMHALDIPTTRALAVVATGTSVARDTMLPGAVLARVAASHLRVGTFEYASATGGPDLVRQLADHAIDRHHPQAAGADSPYLSLLGHVADAQADLVARWMLVGFIHGVMNTDNMTISGETIDYGPCAFMDEFDPSTVFSSIDHGGRYAYGRQPTIALWNLARLAETLLPLIDHDSDAAVAAATELLEGFPSTFQQRWFDHALAKLGLAAEAPATQVDRDLAVQFVDLLGAQRVDLTLAMRSLSFAVRGDAAPARSLFADPTPFDAWADRWAARRIEIGADREATAATMDLVNPIYVPRNHVVEAALAAATDGDLGPFHDLVDVVRSPYRERPEAEAYARPAPEDFGPYRTFCGT